MDSLSAATGTYIDVRRLDMEDVDQFRPPTTADVVGGGGDAEGLDLFDAVVGLWLPGVLAVFGVIGNALSLWVLSGDPAGTATLASLKALALSDLVLLVGALCQQIVPMLCDFASVGDSAICLRRGYLQVYAWPVVCIAQMSSVWFAVLISTERYLAVCAPLTAYRIGRRRLRYAVVVIVTASIAYNVPRFFEFRPKAGPLVPPPPVDAAVDQSLTALTPAPRAAVTMIVLDHDTWLRSNEVYQSVHDIEYFAAAVRRWTAATRLLSSRGPRYATRSTNTYTTPRCTASWSTPYRC